jgi:hypothetical protein
VIQYKEKMGCFIRNIILPAGYDKTKKKITIINLGYQQNLKTKETQQDKTIKIR